MWIRVKTTKTQADCTVKHTGTKCWFLFVHVSSYVGIMPIVRFFCCERLSAVVSNSLLTLMQVIKMSSFCSKCKRTHPSLRMESFRRQPRCDFRSTEGLLPMFFTILEEPPLLCLLVPIESGSVTQERKHVLKCLLATLFVDLRAESWGKTQQQGNHLSLFFWPHFIVSLLFLLRN